jgi:hypothetical protein
MLESRSSITEISAVPHVTPMYLFLDSRARGRRVPYLWKPVMQEYVAVAIFNLRQMNLPRVSDRYYSTCKKALPFVLRLASAGTHIYTLVANRPAGGACALFRRRAGQAREQQDDHRSQHPCLRQQNHGASHASSHLPEQNGTSGELAAPGDALSLSPNTASADMCGRGGGGMARSLSLHRWECNVEAGGVRASYLWTPGGSDQMSRDRRSSVGGGFRFLLRGRNMCGAVHGDAS